MKKLSGLLMIGVVGMSLNTFGGPVGSDFTNPIVIGTVSHGASYSDTQNNSTSNGFGNDCGQAGDDIFYSFTLSQAANVSVSHCSSALSDTYLSLFNSSRQVISTNDDFGPVCNQDYRASVSLNLAPGTYYIASEGYHTYYGNITTQVAVQACQQAPGSTISNPVIISNNAGACLNFSDYKNNGACFGDEYGQKSDDIYYKLTLSSPQTVTVTNCGSSISDSYLTLLDMNGIYIDHNDDSPSCSNIYHSHMVKSLAAGTYYIVQEGYGSTSGWINIQVKTGGSCRMEQPESVNKVTKKLTYNSENNEISVYPNPATDNVYLRIPFLHDQISVKVNDLAGRTMKTIETSSSETEITTSDLDAGMYYLSFQYQNQTVIKKLQIIK